MKKWIYFIAFGIVGLPGVVFGYCLETWRVGVYVGKLLADEASISADNWLKRKE